MPPPTDRQVQVLRTVVEQGGQRRAAASALNLSERTVTEHLRELYAKLGARNIVEAMQLLGWVRLPRE